MHITLVKKILKDGNPCQKCGDVLNKLETSEYIKYIDEIITADERDDASAGMQLAKHYQVDRAPFFIVKNKDQTETKIYTVYLKFVKEVLDKKTSEKDELLEIMENQADLDFL